MAWTLERAYDALRRAGVDVVASDLRLEPRDGRTVAFLPGDRMAWLADDERGLRGMQTERRVLRLLEARCRFRAPRVLFESPDGTLDVRAAVSGTCEPWTLYARVKSDAALAARIGAELGAILAEQHTRIAEGDAAPWLASRPSWPEPSAWIRERVLRVTGDPALVADIERLLDRYDAVVVDDADRVLVHADVGLHNVAIDPDTFAVLGIFDYADAAWADRHHDFRYLLFDVDRDEMLDAALAVYEPRTGRAIDRDRVRLYNAACAASFLAFRDGVPPEERSCGRTLAEDLAWTRAAIARAGKIVSTRP